MRLLVLAALLSGPAALADDDSETRTLRQGFVDDEPTFKWSAPVLDRGGWVVGLNHVAYGIDDRVTLGVEATNLLVGHYNLRARVELANRGVAASVDGGIGLATPIALAAILVPDFRGSTTLLLVDVGVPITWTPEAGRFVTLRPWFAAAAGRVGADDESLSLLLGRPVLTGPGVTATGEVHLARRVGLAATQDVGLDLFGGDLTIGSRTGAAVLLATGPVRVNLGLKVTVEVDLTGRTAVRPGLGPAIDVWVRL